MRRAALELDFVAPARRRRRAGLLLLAAALALAAWELDRHRTLLEANRALDEAEALLATARPALPANRERQAEQIKTARAVVGQLALPWPALIDSLERAALPGVALLQIQPDAERRVLRISAEARGAASMHEYLRRVEAAPAFVDVHLINHQVQLDDPRRPVQFSLQASFRKKS